MSDVELINGDCLEKIKNIKDNSIDLVVCDPPYKMNSTTGSTTGSGFKDRWKGNLYAGDVNMVFDTNIAFSSWLPEIYRVLKEQSHCYLFCNDKNLKELLVESEKAGFRESNVLVWIKNNACPNRYYMKNIEFVVFLYKGKAKPINNMGDKCTLGYKNISGKYKNHPTEKPVELLKHLILNSSKEHDVVLDCFMGSGSTGVACIYTDRNFIGIEIEKEYYDIAEKRINEAIQDRYLDKKYGYNPYQE